MDVEAANSSALADSPMKRAVKGPTLRMMMVACLGSNCFTAVSDGLAHLKNYSGGSKIYSGGSK